MGLNKGDQQKTFVSIVNSQLAIRVKDDTPGATARKLSKGPHEGQTIYEEYYKSISGMIIKIDFTSRGTNGKTLQTIEVIIHDAGEDFLLSIPWESYGLRDSFVKILPNIDPLMPVELFVWKNKDDKTSLAIKQGGEFIKWYYTKEHPNGLPEPIKTNYLGKEGWDFSRAEQFLYNELIKYAQNFSPSVLKSTSHHVATYTEADLQPDDDNFDVQSLIAPPEEKNDPENYIYG